MQNLTCDINAVKSEGINVIKVSNKQNPFPCFYINRYHNAYMTLAVANY